MNIIKYKKYNFFDNFKNNINVLVLSDIHFSNYVSKRTKNLFKNLSNEKINYLLIPGDLIDYYDVVYDNKLKDEIFESLKYFTEKNIKVFIILGNHDFYENKSKKRYIYDISDKVFFKELKKIPNIHILNNEIYEDKNIIINGISLPIEYYKNNNGIENKDILISTLKKNIVEERKNKIKIMMIHSPFYINDNDIKEYIKIYDTVICGHFHNGAVPILLDDIWKSNNGIIGPYYKKFPLNCRGILNDKIIVCGAINTVQPKGLIYKLIDFCFPIHVCKIEFIKDINKKIIKKEKYKRNS